MSDWAILNCLIRRSRQLEFQISPNLAIESPNLASQDRKQSRNQSIDQPAISDRLTRERKMSPRSRLAKQWILLVTLLASAPQIALEGWGRQGHRLVAAIAANHLTSIGKQNVAWLLDGRPLAEIASWADDYRTDNYQTYPWHYVSIPPDVTAYDRDRDCPRQPGVAAGTGPDKWRDCIVDRILYLQGRLADVTLDRPDRATALKFLVHFVGDLHQPFHSIGVGRGGNDVRVSVFGTSNCSTNPSFQRPCNLHAVWDDMLIDHRGWNDSQWISALEELITRQGWQNAEPGTPAEWAGQSLQLAKAALVPDQGTIDETYYRRHITAIDERLALAGVRLAALLNKSLTAPAPR